jgi:hypothetical protein
MSGFTQAQIDALTAALAGGAKEVNYGDGRGSVVYQDTATMLALRDRMIREVQNQNPAGGGKLPLYHPTVFTRR